MRYKAIIFDLDGTLLNTALDMTNCLNLYLEKFSYPKRTVKEVEHAMGAGAAYLVHKLLPENHTEEEFQAFFNEYIPYYESHGKDLTRPYDGILELLNDLKKDGIKLAVVSSKPQKGVETVCEHYFKGMFDICIGDGNGIKLKPDPEGIMLALKTLKVDKKDALYVGDSEYDVLAAKNADMDGTSVSWGYREKEDIIKLKPMYIADTADDLKKIIYEK